MDSSFFAWEIALNSVEAMNTMWGSVNPIKVISEISNWIALYVVQQFYLKLDPTNWMFRCQWLSKIQKTSAGEPEETEKQSRWVQMKQVSRLALNVFSNSYIYEFFSKRRGQKQIKF